MRIGILKNTSFCVAFHSGLDIATKFAKGTRRCMLQEPPKNRLCLRPPLTAVSLLRLSLHLPCPSCRKPPQLYHSGYCSRRRNPLK